MACRECVCVCMYAAVRSGRVPATLYPPPPPIDAARREIIAGNLAALLSPRGQVNGAELPGRLYAGSLCVRWRDEFGGTLLIVSSLVWAILHVYVERKAHRTRR